MATLPEPDYNSVKHAVELQAASDARERYGKAWGGIMAAMRSVTNGVTEPIQDETTAFNAAAEFLEALTGRLMEATGWSSNQQQPVSTALITQLQNNIIDLEQEKGQLEAGATRARNLELDLQEAQRKLATSQQELQELRETTGQSWQDSWQLKVELTTLHGWVRALARTLQLPNPDRDVEQLMRDVALGVAALAATPVVAPQPTPAPAPRPTPPPAQPQPTPHPTGSPARTDGRQPGRQGARRGTAPAGPPAQPATTPAPTAAPPAPQPDDTQTDLEGSQPTRRRLSFRRPAASTTQEVQQ